MSVKTTSDRRRAGTARTASLYLALLAAAFAMPVHQSAFAQQTQDFGGRPAGSRKVTAKSPEEAYKHGLGALRSGHPEMAVDPLEFAADSGMLLAQYYLGRIYADNSLAIANHARAFELFQKIVDEYADIDIDDDRLTPVVAKAMVALAGYYRTGVSSHGVVPDLDKAAMLLRHAAITMRDEEAQFEFAKILLKGEGVKASPAEGVRLLRELAKHGHPSAQAFLADLYWRGNHVPKDPTQAYLLITLAIDNAPDAERIWIEDSYQHIFCGAGEGVRKQAQGSVADWRSQYGRRKPERPQQSVLNELQPRAARTCSNGVVVPLQRNEVASEPQRRASAASGGEFTAAPMPGASVGAPGASGGFTIRDAGQLSLAPRP